MQNVLSKIAAVPLIEHLRCGEQEGEEDGKVAAVWSCVLWARFRHLAPPAQNYLGSPGSVFSYLEHAGEC